MSPDGPAIREKAVERDESGDSRKQGQQDIKGDARRDRQHAVGVEPFPSAPKNILPPSGRNLGWRVRPPSPTRLVGPPSRRFQFERCGLPRSGFVLWVARDAGQVVFTTARRKEHDKQSAPQYQRPQAGIPGPAGTVLPEASTALLDPARSLLLAGGCSTNVPCRLKFVSVGPESHHPGRCRTGRAHRIPPKHRCHESDIFRDRGTFTSLDQFFFCRVDPSVDIRTIE